MRICITLPSDIVATLKERQAETGLTPSLQIRQALQPVVGADPVRQPAHRPLVFTPRRETR